jgi:DNA-3-methyladenine glycosylase II
MGPRNGRGALPYDWNEAVAHLRARDPRLHALIDAVGDQSLSLRQPFTPFEALATSIAYQQLNGRAAATILGRVQALYPRRFPRPQDILDTRDAALRACGLSRSKIAAVKDLAAKTLDGTVPAQGRSLQKLSDDEIVERLTVVRGIGRWTVEMLLMFRLGRPDVLPVDDFGVRKGFSRVYRKRSMATPRELAKAGERWRPFRSVASWYFWRALELP